MKWEFETFFLVPTFFLPSVVTFSPRESTIIFYPKNAESVAFLDMEFLTENFGIWRKDEGPAAPACFALRIVLRIIGSLKVS